MINREDMLELTRRMTLKRNCFDRAAGCYFDGEGEWDGSFNVNFLNLTAKDREINLAVAKTIPFARTNEQLKEYRLPMSAAKPDSIWRLLLGLRSCGLKNDGLMEVLYELASEKYQTKGPYGIYVYHGTYDIPRKGEDHASQWESEEIYEFLIAAFCPVNEEYEPGEPECGFLYPAFSDRNGDINRVDFFNADPAHPHREILEGLLGLNG